MTLINATALDRKCVGAQWRDLRFSDSPSLPPRTTAPLSFVISTGAQRSGEICGSAVLYWKCFQHR